MDDPSEECDDGNSFGNDGCVACLKEDNWVCDRFSNFCETICGDGILVGDENCDPNASQ